MKRSTLNEAILTSGLCLVLTACSPYSFSGGRTALVKSAHVRVFGNETPEFGIEESLTQGVINGFINDNQIEIVGVDNAEAILSGTVVDYERRAYTFDETDRVTEYIVEIWVNADLTKPGSDAAVWSVTRFRGFGIYSAENEDEQAGQERAIAKIAEDLLNRTIKSW